MTRTELVWIYAASLLSGCITDGRYVVRGTVSEGEGASSRPVAGASIAVGDARDGNSNGRALTAADGTYRAQYGFGGLFPFISGSNPTVTVAAPGYATSRFELQGTSAHPGLTRRSCDPPKPGCLVCDVVLSPISSTASAP